MNLFLAKDPTETEKENLNLAKLDNQDFSILFHSGILLLVPLYVLFHPYLISVKEERRAKFLLAYRMPCYIAFFCWGKSAKIN